MGKLTGKTALITGGTSGIGLATARLFLHEGGTVIITGRADKHFEAARAEFEQSVEIIASDAASVCEINQLAELVTNKFESIDILFLNAGMMLLGDLPSLTEEEFDQIFSLNVKGPLFTAQAFLPILSNNSSIIITTSNSTRVRVDALHIYRASKAAAAQLVLSLAGELIGRGIRVNAISPGPVTTNIAETIYLMPEHSQAEHDQTISKVPMGRFADPSELANAALFLASDDSSFMTGSAVDVDGGWTPGVY